MLALLLALLLAGCGEQRTIFGFPIDEVRSRLARGDYAFLNHAATGRRELRRVSRLGEGAYHTMALVFDDLDLGRPRDQLLELSWQRESAPWQRQSVRLLLKGHLDSERFDSARDLAKTAVVRFPGDAEIDHALNEALYHLREYDELSRRLAEGTAPGSAGHMAAERALWASVIAHESATAAHDEILAVFTEHRTDEVHTRLAVYVNARPQLSAGFSAAELALMLAKQQSSEGRHSESLEPFAEALGAQPELASEPVLRDLFTAGLNSDDRSLAARTLSALGAGAALDGARRAQAHELSGRLYRMGDRFAAAAGELASALSLRRPGEEFQRVLWYLRDVELRLDPIGAARTLPQTLSQIDDPEYFDDYFDSMGNALAERESWSEMRATYALLSGIAGAGVLARYELTLAELIRAGVISGSEADATELLRRAADQRESRFHAIVAAVILKETPDLLWAWEREAAEPMAPAAETTARVDGYLRVGLLDDAFELVEQEVVSLEQGIEVSRALASRGRVRESIRAALILRDRVGGNRELMKLAYPYAYSSLIDELAEREGLDTHLLRALIREESLFDPQAQSWAGAIGLSQLMPATAADIASRMGLEYDDLTDPRANMEIGAHYLSRLIRQFGSPAVAIAAYNAGQGRLREWERSLPTGSLLLFHEAMPFDETRLHVRKVLVSAVYYGYLYADVSPAATVGYIYGDI